MRRIKEKHRRNAAMAHLLTLLAHLLTFLVWRFSADSFIRATWREKDVREHEEWRRNNLPGALLLPCSRHGTKE